jgi:DMSO/TMAO reductase YedYZ heme-binding membrane subunit
MNSSTRNWIVLAGAMAAALVPSLLYWQAEGTGDDELAAVLTWTARGSTLLFLVVFAARPLNQLVKSAPTRALLRQRRLWGVAFAGVHTVHLALVVWVLYLVLDTPMPWLTAMGGGLAYALMYLMLITSFDGPARALGGRNWRILHRAGLYWIAIIFAYTIAGRWLDGAYSGYLVIVSVLALLALSIRVLAWSTGRRTK